MSQAPQQGQKKQLLAPQENVNNPSTSLIAFEQWNQVHKKLRIINTNTEPSDLNNYNIINVTAFRQFVNRNPHLTLQEIADKLGITSKVVIHYFLKQIGWYDRRNLPHESLS
jgi:hypothetical protein